MNTRPGAASNMAMLTVHKLSTTHLILADNDIAKQARQTGIEEALVVIDRGAIVRVHTPPCEGDEFASGDDWIFAAIREAYERGHDDGRCSITSPEASKERDAAAPEGWALWRDLKPGTIATSGDPDEVIALYAIGEVGYFRTPGGFTFDSCTFGQYRTRHPFNFKAERVRAWPFFKVLRAGMTCEQMLAVIEAVEAGEPIETAIQGHGHEAAQ